MPGVRGAAPDERQGGRRTLGGDGDLPLVEGAGIDGLVSERLARPGEGGAADVLGAPEVGAQRGASSPNGANRSAKASMVAR